MVFRHRLRTARERRAKSDPVLVPGRFIAPSLFRQVAHQLDGKDAERGAEEKGARDPSILSGKEKLRSEGAGLHAAGRAPILVRIERCREDARLRRYRERLLRRYIDVLAESRDASLMMRRKRADRCVRARM